MPTTQSYQPPQRYRAPSIFQVGGKRSSYAIALLWVLIVVHAIELPTYFIWPASIDASGHVSGVIGILAAPIGVGATVAFLIWCYNCYRNVIILPVAGRKFSPVWAVLGYIIPLANMVLPYLVARETWKASTPGLSAADQHAWQSAKVTPVITGWWLATILATLAAIGQVVVQVVSQVLVETGMGKAIASPGQVAVLAALVSVFFMAQALLQIKMIKALDARQLARGRELEPAA